MIEFIKRIVDIAVGSTDSNVDGVLKIEERHFFSLAFKSVISSRRSTWRMIRAAEQKEEHSRMANSAEVNEKTPSNIEVLHSYREKIEKDMLEIINYIVEVVSSKLVKRSKSPEVEVFYHKMYELPSLNLLIISRIGDYLRYHAEFSQGTLRQEVSERSLASYKRAHEIASEKLPAISYIRLGLILNYSVFYYEIMGKHEQAYNLAKNAFDEALAALEQQAAASRAGETTPEGVMHRESALIIQLLRDNLNLWANEINKQSREDSGVEEETGNENVDGADCMEDTTEDETRDA